MMIIQIATVLPLCTLGYSWRSTLTDRPRTKSEGSPDALLLIFFVQLSTT